MPPPMTPEELKRFDEASNHPHESSAATGLAEMNKLGTEYKLRYLTTWARTARQFFDNHAPLAAELADRRHLEHFEFLLAEIELLTERLETNAATLRNREDVNCRLLAENAQLQATLSVERAMVAFHQKNEQFIKAENERLRSLVNEQAEDDGLWFVAETCAEAYLQQELRRLHAAIEGGRIASIASEQRREGLPMAKAPQAR